MNENQQQTSNLKPKNKFFTFCWAFIPGAGQMYHGLMKKGLSIMTLFCAIIAVSVIVYMPAILFVLPIIWFYSFFDTLGRMNTPMSELALIEDKGFEAEINVKWGDGENKKIGGFLEKRHIFFGVCVIAVGMFLFLREMWVSFAGYINDQIYYMVRNAIDRIPAFLVPLICIAVGWRLIAGKKQDGEEK